MNNFKKMLLLLKSKCKKYGIKYVERELSTYEMQKFISDSQQKILFDNQQKILFDGCEYNVIDDIKGAMNIHKNKG